MTHRFHPGAAEEFEESVRYYQDRSQALGERFAAEVRRTIRRIVEKRCQSLQIAEMICGKGVSPCKLQK